MFNVWKSDKYFSLYLLSTLIFIKEAMLFKKNFSKYLLTT